MGELNKHIALEIAAVATVAILAINAHGPIALVVCILGLIVWGFYRLVGRLGLGIAWEVLGFALESTWRSAERQLRKRGG